MSGDTKPATTVYLYELAWILPSIAIPVGMLVALVVTAFGVGIHLPGAEGRIDPTKVAQTPPFDQPGLTSRDLVHGLMIHKANINLMLLPGQIARATARFDRPGEYPFLCHEYCGAAHHTMWGKVVVE